MLPVQFVVVDEQHKIDGQVAVNNLDDCENLFVNYKQITKLNFKINHFYALGIKDNKHI